MEFKILPVVALRGLVVFPNSSLHFDIGREKSINAMKTAMENDRYVLLCSQKDADVDFPNNDDINKIGTVVKVKQIVKISSDTYRVAVHGEYKAEIVSFESENQDKYFTAVCVPFSEFVYDEDDIEITALSRNLRAAVMNIYSLDKTIPTVAINEINSTKLFSELVYSICSNIEFEYNQLQLLLEEVDIKTMAINLLKLLNREIEILKVNKKIDDKTRCVLDKAQHEYYLKEQIKTIKDELGERDEYDDELETYKEKILSLNLPSDSEEKLLKELSKYSKLPPNSSEASVISVYLDTVLDLPWNISTKENVSVCDAEKILNRDHYGLDKVKERILEYFAVKEIGGTTNGNIICLVGPPGVGKTSIAKSLAEALNRNYVRISLGGVKDESEIRGHRKTYIGSMPGRIISALNQAKSNNPLILLDEIDKMSSDYKGDPASAMLEVLDYEQNFEFKDNYIEIPFDLSDVLFITTANDLYSIPSPLRDRMEIIELEGYTIEEKLNIAIKHLIPKQMAKHNLKNVKFHEDSIKKIIQEYTREAGVRTLDRLIAQILRKVAKVYVSEHKSKANITKNTVKKYLGKEKYLDITLDKKDSVGVANGLAWTGYGGDVLNIEVAVMPGTGKTVLTGNLGDVMKESATTAVSYIRSVADKYGINPDFVEKKDIHVHVPEGAVPKDGPSAGITMATAIISALTDKKVKSNIAMTGEITLRGKVLPIGGLKEKTLAALRYGVDTVIIPDENKRDIDELEPTVKENLKIITAKDYAQVAKAVFRD